MRHFGLKDEFVKQTGLVFVGMGLFNLFNLLYHFFMLRMLSPSDYGHLNTLISLFMVISVPAGTVQATVTRFFSSFKIRNQYQEAIQLLRQSLVLMLIIGLSFFIIVFLTRFHISTFLQISSTGLIILFGLSLIFSMVIPILWGGLQGLQKFGLLTLNLIMSSGLKLALGVLFVFLGLGLSGAMTAVAVSYIITTILSLAVLGVSLFKEKSLSHGRRNQEHRPLSRFSEVYRYSFSAGLVLLCFMVLTNIDLIFVKHFFTPVEAGYYSIAQMVGKIILILPMPVVTVMFPKLSATEAQITRIPPALGKSLKIAILLCGAATLFSFLFPSFIIKLLSGKVYLECSPLVRLLSFNMTFFSLTLILLYYHLSTPRRGFLYPLFLLTILEIGLILLFHETLIQVLMSVGLVAFCLTGINFYLAYRPDPIRRKEGGDPLRGERK